MKVLLKQGNKYWTGGVDYIGREFIMTTEIRKAYEFKSRKDAKENLIYWHDAGVGCGGEWEYVEHFSLDQSDLVSPGDIKDGVFGTNEDFYEAAADSSGWTVNIEFTGSDGKPQIISSTCSTANTYYNKQNQLVAKLRTINEVCTEALKCKHKKMKLLQLQYEVRESKSKYKKHEYEFMDEYIEGFLEEIFSKERQRQIRNSFTDDD